MKLSNILLAAAVAVSSGAFAQTAEPYGGFISRRAAQPAPAAKAQLADNQRYVGNEINSYCNQGMGIQGYTGTFKCGGMIAKELLENYVGCKIVGMRFYLCEAVGKSTAFVSTVASYNNYINDSPILSKEVEQTRQGWNDVMFDNAYTIDEGTTLRGFMVGYSFEQTADGKPDSPIAVSGKGTTMGFMIYGDLDNGLTWYNMGTADGCLMTQIIVEREGGFLAYDLSLDQFLPPVLYSKPGQTRAFGLCLHNVGTASVAGQNATFGVAVDGSEVAEFKNEGTIAPGDRTSYVDASVEMPGDLAEGQHEMAVYVKSVDGREPEGNLKNDRITSSFKVYGESFPRQKQLVEQFTSQYCVYCPRGYDVLNGLAEKRGDIAWVAYHGNMGGGQIDEYTLDDTYNFMAFSCGGNLPAAAVNRYYYDSDGINYYGTVGLTTAYPSSDTANGVAVFDELIDMSNDIYPSFTSVGIDSSYDPDTRTLDVKVSGKTAADIDDMLGKDAAISVYLTEDGLWGKQKDGDRMRPRYPHDHTLRMILTSPYGDALDADGGEYEKSFSAVLYDKWDADNMNIIAVVSRPMKTKTKNGTLYLSSKGDDLWVDNAETVKLGESTSTGLQGVYDGTCASPLKSRIYTIDGRFAGAEAARLPKGLYVRNGRKFVVK